MGDISEIRGLVVIFSFIAVFVIIIGLIPSQFLIADYEGRTIDVPDYFEAIDLLFYIDTWNQTLDDSGSLQGGYYIYTFVFGGHNLRLLDRVNPQLWMQHYWYWLFFPTGHHYMKWLNTKGVSRGTDLTPSELDSDYTEGNIRYRVKCSHFQMDAFFGFNETTYSSPSDAWDNNELALLLAIEFDEATTSINAWSLISMLLFFQLPDVHWIINALIAIPLWIAIAYLAFIMILRTIGAVFGGGGA